MKKAGAELLFGVKSRVVCPPAFLIFEMDEIRISRVNGYFVANVPMKNSVSHRYLYPQGRTVA